MSCQEWQVKSDRSTETGQEFQVKSWNVEGWGGWSKGTYQEWLIVRHTSSVNSDVLGKSNQDWLGMSDMLLVTGQQ